MTAVVKRCACGAQHDRGAWEKLPDKKVYTLENGEVHEQRRCPCGSHIVVVLAKGEEQEPKAGDTWKSKTSRQRIKIVDVVPMGVGCRYLSGHGRIFLSFEEFYRIFTPYRRTL